jgi:signal transduction histidine kinase
MKAGGLVYTSSPGREGELVEQLATFGATLGGASSFEEIAARVVTFVGDRLGVPAWIAVPPRAGGRWRVSGTSPLTILDEDPQIVALRASPELGRLAPAGWPPGETLWALPLPAGTRVGGLLLFACAQLTDEGRVLFEAIAPLTALAVANALLRDETRELSASLRELRVAQERLVRGERLRALGQMATGVAHDFNNVLNAILQRAALLATSSPPTAREGLHRIEQAALRGAETVRRLQDFTRQRRDQDFEAVDLREVIEEALRGAGEGGALEKIHVEREIDADLPEVMGAYGELVEVLAHLFSNALDAMEEGGTLSITARRSAERVSLSVRDNGTGMDSPTRERAFDPFFTTKGVRGTGLGLSVVYGLVERHGGEVTLESMPLVGTTVTISLPSRNERDRVPTLTRVARVGGRATRVLLIEDDEVNREATRALLEFSGFAVTEAATGSDGIACFSPDRFDLVLSDLGMPDRSGWEVARVVKGRAAEMPVALITGWGLTISEEEARRRGVDLIIKKPVAPQRLLDALAGLLGS